MNRKIMLYTWVDMNEGNKEEQAEEEETSATHKYATIKITNNKIIYFVFIMLETYIFIIVVSSLQRFWCIKGK